MNELSKDNAMDVFKEKVSEKLRADIGELLPEAALQEMAQRAIEEQFFKPRISKDSYGHIREEKPSWFVEEVAKIAAPMIRDHIEKIIKEKEEDILKAIEDFKTQANLFLLTTEAMRRNTTDDLLTVANSIVDRFRQGS